MTRICRVILALLIVLSGPTSAWAAVGPWAANDHGRLRLISAEENVAGDENELRLGLQFELEPGWKIYWRSPGDAGFPPRLDWSQSENLAAARMEWPAPHRFSLFGLETFGYGDEVIFPLIASVNRNDQALDLQIAVTYLTCSEICVPYDETVSLTLPSGPAKAAAERFLIDHYQAQVPRDGADFGLRMAEAFLEGDPANPLIVARATSEAPFSAPDLLVEGPPGFYYAKPEVTLGDTSEGGGEAVFRIAVTGSDAESVLEGKPLTLTLLDEGTAMEARVMARYPAGTTPPPRRIVAPVAAMISPADWLAMLGLALLGGLILNLMPCVLPVLSIKLLSIVEQGGRARRDIRASFVATAAGILVSFWLLAGVAVAVKSAGLAVGWGIQFQQPLFLLFMAVLVTLFACNLLGFLEVPLPAWMGTRLAGGGGEKGLAGSFAAGAFATLLATPCSAPFLGTAVGFALARGAGEIFAIFTALGLGLALPYLLVALLPGLAQRLPRPGMWMVWLRRILGMALIATALWLLWVLEAQTSLLAAVVAAGLLFFMALALASRLFAWRRPAIRSTAPLLSLLLGVAVLTVPLLLPGGAASSRVRVEATAWPNLDTARIASLVDAGQVVFVDVTADWCLTCQVNKKVVLDDERVATLLQSDAIALQRGDWTLPDDTIARYLQSFERYGIPFNAVYGPGLPDGEALPELLSIDTVLDALERAGGATSGS